MPPGGLGNCDGYFSFPEVLQIQLLINNVIIISCSPNTESYTLENLPADNPKIDSNSQ